MDAIVEGYRRSLEWVLRHQPATLVVTVLTLVITIWMYVVIPKGFLPSQDTGLVTAVLEAEPQVAFTELSRLQADGHRGGAQGSGRRRCRLRRRRRSAQPDTERFAPEDHAEAARRARRARSPRWSTALSRRSPPFPASPSTSSRCRTCRSPRARAARSTNTRSSAPTRARSPSGRPSSPPSWRGRRY